MNNFQAALPFMPFNFYQPQGSFFLVESKEEKTRIPQGAGLTAILCTEDSSLTIQGYKENKPVSIIYNISDNQTKQIDSYSEIKQEVLNLKGAIEKIQQDVVALKGLKGGKNGVHE